MGEGGREGGGREGGKEGRREGGKEGRREGGRDEEGEKRRELEGGRVSGQEITDCTIDSPSLHIQTDYNNPSHACMHEQGLIKTHVHVHVPSLGCRVYPYPLQLFGSTSQRCTRLGTSTDGSPRLCSCG